MNLIQIFKRFVAIMLNILIPKSHLGIILRYNLNQSMAMNITEDTQLMPCNNAQQIVDTYRSLGSKDKIEHVQNLLKQGNECWFALHKGQIAGSIWIYYNKVFLPNFSGRTFSKKKEIIFNDGIGYLGHEIIFENMRGKGVGQNFFFLLIDEYKKRKTINKFVMTMGANNTANIRRFMKCDAKLIGIVQATRILGYTMRKEYFLDNKEKCWD